MASAFRRISLGMVLHFVLTITPRFVSASMIYPWESQWRSADTLIDITPDSGDPILLNEEHWMFNPGSWSAQADSYTDWGTGFVHVRSEYDSIMGPDELSATMSAELHSASLNEGGRYFSFAETMFYLDFHIDVTGIYMLEVSMWDAHTLPLEPRTALKIGRYGDPPLAPLVDFTLVGNDSASLPATFVTLTPGDYYVNATTMQWINVQAPLLDTVDGQCEIEYRLVYVSPEPGTLVLVGGAALLLLKRRR